MIDFLRQMAVALNGAGTTGDLEFDKAVNEPLSSVVVQK